MRALNTKVLREVVSTEQDISERRPARDAFIEMMQSMTISEVEERKLA